MKKFILSLFVALCALSASAQSFGPSISGNNFSSRSRSVSDEFLSKGYHGMIEGASGVCFGCGTNDIIAVSTTHGWQFNPRFFLGGMLGIRECQGATYTCVAADSRFYLSKKRFAPYINAQGGVRVLWDGNENFEHNPLYYGVGFGFRLAIYRKFGVSFSLNYGPGCVRVKEGSVQARFGIEF